MNTIITLSLFILCIASASGFSTAIYYDVPTWLNSTGYYGNFQANSLVIFNASVYDNDILVGSCFDVTYCYIQSGEAWIYSHKYAALLSATNTNNNTNFYYTLNYDWYYSRSLFAALFATLCTMSVFVFIVIIILVCISLFICINRQESRSNDV